MIKNLILGLTLALTSLNASSQVYVPNAFSPDDNGVNDVFMAVSSDTLDSYDLQIYSVSGELLFHSTDINYGWLGGVYYYAPAGIYPYKLTYKRYNVTKETVMYGCVKLLR
jgi:hypothetical protein